MSHNQETQDQIQDQIQKLFDSLENATQRCVEEHFTEPAQVNEWNLNDVCHAVSKYFEKDIKNTLKIYNGQKLIQEQLNVITPRLQLVIEDIKIIKDLREEVKQLRIRYEDSFKSIHLSVDSFQDTSRTLSELINRTKEDIDKFPTKDSIEIMIHNLTRELISQNTFDSRLNSIDERIRSNEISSRNQFLITIATLIIGFIAVIVPQFYILYEDKKNSDKSKEMSSTELECPKPLIVTDASFTPIILI
ncbi:hypothetical protein [Synechocystis sp. PCC 6714]|uniref:hypothetical protein n=2 Tax=Cyanophyceae TaxID=3028117 RepID=UPI00040AC0E8|nr:hypothetical protein [Synechocystis sp. PCC 6714]AIE76202.1 hypothetical protein D082_50400 [Synechocystis sp. PCC 6714]